MLMSPPPSTTPSLGPAGQSMQLLGNPATQAGSRSPASQDPKMMRMLMQFSGQGGFGNKPMGPTLGPVQQGPLGQTPPQPNQGGFG